ncbi:hypothetical protein NMG60_11018733 [Bertholletia excelsa]
MSADNIAEMAINSLGKGFDITSDFRLKYCKGKDRLVLLNHNQTRELHVPGFGPFESVSIDIKCDKGELTRYQSDVLDFNQMSQLMNQKSSLPGKIPSGLFNSMFGFQSGSWAVDAANTKCMGLDGCFILLFSVHLERYRFTLSDEVRNAVPSSWDPCALARNIFSRPPGLLAASWLSYPTLVCNLQAITLIIYREYGTHIVVGVSVGGQDVVLVRQDRSSKVDAAELKSHLHDLGDQLFTGTCSFSPRQSKSKEHRHKVPHAFNGVFDPQPVALEYNSFKAISSKDGITVICFKRGGDTSVTTHCEWLPTVASKPDAVRVSFIPITSLLKGVTGKGFLSHAINLYIRYKPPIADLQYFLDFQMHKTWAPVYNDLRLGPTIKAFRTPALRFNFMGPKLYVNTAQVTVGRRPVTGMRLFLEGMKCNRLAVHLQHLSSTPTLFQNKLDDPLAWRGCDDPDDERYLEPVHWKKFSHVCTAPVKCDPDWLTQPDVSYIVTGAQLRLLFSKASSFYVAKSQWIHSPSEHSQRSSGFISAISTSVSGMGGGADKEEEEPVVVVDSGVYPTGPPGRVESQKLLKFVDLAQLCRGPLDSPGYWLVTGARLVLEKGKICLHVKFSLLNWCSPDNF